MSQYLNQVKEFHENFDHPIDHYNNNVALKTRQLRVALLFEELIELAEALDVKSTIVRLSQDVVAKHNGSVDGDNVNHVEVIDALADIQYVLSGAVLALGHSEHFDQAFTEVHNSNMSKMCNNQEDILATQEKYKDVETVVNPKGDKFIITRKLDNKVLKNANYTEANLKQFIK